MSVIVSPIPGIVIPSAVLAFALAVFLPLRPLLRRWIGSEWLCVLWLALLVRLLAPWPFETRFGLMNNLRGGFAPAADSAQPWKVSVTYPKDGGDRAEAVRAVSIPVASPTATRSSVFVDVPLRLWLAGLAASLSILAWRQRQTIRLASRTQPATDERLLAIFGSIPVGFRRNVELRTTDAVGVPTLAGVIRPQIWMPQSWLVHFTDEELRGILLHEIGHARRGDLAIQWLFEIARCVHWFNPLVWLAVRSARFDREMACDAWVLGRLGDEPYDVYGNTLLKTARILNANAATSFWQPASAATVSMASNRGSLPARIAGISRFRPARSWIGMLGVILTIGAVVASTTSRTSRAQTSATPPAESQSSASPGGKNEDVKDLFREAQSYEDKASEAYDKILKLDPHNAAAVAGQGEMDSRLLQYAAPGGSPGDDHAFVSDVRIDAKFVEIDEAAFAKLCATEPVLKSGAPPSSFPELEQPKKTYADIESELNSPGSPGWEMKQGAWVTKGKLGQLFIITSDDQLQEVLKSFDKTKGVDLMAAPAVTTRLGEQARIEVVREFRYPSEYEPDKKSANGWSPKEFVTQELGVSLDVKPDLDKDGMMELDLNPEVSGFLGFLNEKNGKKWVDKNWDSTVGIRRPIFSISSNRSELTIARGQTVVFVGVRIDQSANMDPVKASEDMMMGGGGQPVRGGTEGDGQPVRSITMVFVTPSIVKFRPFVSKGDAEPGASPAPTPAGDGKIPYANPVPGKPGFVTSPYAPDQGYIDLRGFTKGTEVKDPYSGKQILTP